MVVSMTSRDTTPAAAATHEESLRRLGPEGRLRIAFELSDLTHAFAVAGIRDRHPEYSEVEARRELAKILYGSGSSR
jgi:hypothetical protein